VLSCSADFRISTIPNTTTPSYSYVVAFAGKICYTNERENTITCCLFNGTTVWQFKNNIIMREPGGITVDENGNLYVVGEQTANIVVISADGQYQNQILTKDDGLNKPIYFGKIR
jgi:sugar lactone lactonase YvrE